jgi:hypothetical protein
MTQEARVMQPLVDGAKLFDIMDSKGIPLDISLIQFDLHTHGQFAVDWAAFADRAIERGWRVYQIHDRIQYAMKESDCFTQEYMDVVMSLFRLHICRTVPEFSHCLIRGAT